MVRATPSVLERQWDPEQPVHDYYHANQEIGTTLIERAARLRRAMNEQTQEVQLVDPDTGQAYSRDSTDRPAKGLQVQVVSTPPDWYMKLRSEHSYPKASGRRIGREAWRQELTRKCTQQWAQAVEQPRSHAGRKINSWLKQIGLSLSAIIQTNACPIQRHQLCQQWVHSQIMLAMSGSRLYSQKRGRELAKPPCRKSLVFMDSTIRRDRFMAALERVEKAKDQPYKLKRRADGAPAIHYDTLARQMSAEQNMFGVEPSIAEPMGEYPDVRFLWQFRHDARKLLDGTTTHGPVGDICSDHFDEVTRILELSEAPGGSEDWESFLAMYSEESETTTSFEDEHSYDESYF